MAYIDTVGDIIRVTVAASYPNKQVQECNWHCHCIASGGGDSRSAVAAQVNSLAAVHIYPTLMSTVKYLGCRVALVLSGTPYSPVIVDKDDPGTSTGNIQLPTQVRGVLKFRTALSGRAYRGRIYTFTPTSTWQDADGHPLDTYGVHWATILDQFRAGLSVGGSIWQLVIYHRLVVPKPFIQPTPVTQVINQTVWGTQRRSGDFGRPNLNPWGL